MIMMKTFVVRGEPFLVLVWLCISALTMMNPACAASDEGGIAEVG